MIMIKQTKAVKLGLDAAASKQPDWHAQQTVLTRTGLKKDSA